jgi:glutamate-1-semialdehyde 2,1-aminomutase
VNYARRPGIDSKALERLVARERESFTTMHAESARLAKASAAHWLNGVPMHWMRDWSTPHPLFVRKARGVEVEDVDGNAYIDFCFGDTGAMFGHSPPGHRACAGRDGRLRDHLDAAGRAGGARRRKSSRRCLGLPFWQMTQTATDANRSASALGTRRHGAAAHPGLRRLLSRHGG